MSDRDDAGPRPGDLYTPSEIEGLRAQVRRANADARAELERRGHPGPHPRVRAMIEAGLRPPRERSEGDGSGR